VPLGVSEYVCVCVCVRVSEHVCLAAHTQEIEDVNNEEKKHARIKLSNKPKEKKGLLFLSTHLLSR